MLDSILSRVRGPKVPLGVTAVGLRTPSEALKQATPASALQFHRPKDELARYSPRESLRQAAK
jgi:hypothetical protein